MKEKKGSFISKILAWVLTVALVTGVVPATSLAVEESTYGTVETLTEGLSISGETDKETVSVENTDAVVLKWEAADTSIGRNEDGWWAGIKVTAPSGMTAEDLEKITLQKSTVEGEWSNVISFKDARDAENYVTLWTLVNPELISAGDEIVKKWQFDWNNDGTYEQLISLTLDCEKIVLLDENNVQVYPKLGAVETITGGSVSGSETGTVTVTVEETTLNWSKANAEIGRDKDGWWAGIKVTAPEGLSKDTLKNAQCKYIRHGETVWNQVKFWDVKDSDEAAKTQYVGLWLMLTPAILREVKDANKNITNQYKFDWDNNGEFEQTITFKVVPSDKIVLLKENQSELEFDNVPDSYVYGDTPAQVKVKGGNGNGAVTFEIVDCGEATEVANIDASGNLTLNKAGEFILKAVKAGDDTYNEGTAITKVIRVELAEQKGFAFEDKQPANIKFNDNGNKFINKATGGQSTKDVTYEITAGADVADINSSTGELTIKKAGTVTVKAVKAADEKYKATSSEYTLAIEKCDQKIAFKNGSQVDVVYGALTYSNIAEEVGTSVGTQKITYEIVGGNDIATIDSTGVVSFIDKKVGTVTIKASKAADDCYNACTTEYTLNIAYAITPSEPYNLEGNTKNESGWYTGDVTIKAPEGYTISYSNAITGNVWSDSVVWETEGTNTVDVYLRDANGGITDKIAISNLKIDKTEPKDLKIEYTQSTIKKIFEKLSFGLYTAPVEVKLSATDNVSGIAKFTYAYKNAKQEQSVKAEKLTFEGKTASYTFKIEPQFRDTLTFMAEDLAGNTTNIVDMEVDKDGNETGRENVIVVDTAASKLDTIYTYATNDFKTDKEGIIYTQGDASIQWTISESNFDLADKPVVTVNGVEDTSVTWSQDGVGTLKLSGNGDYKVKMTFTDATQVTNIVYEQEIRIDEIAPEIVVEPVIESTGAEDILYYNGPKTFKITIKEHNFDLDGLAVDVISSNVLKGVTVQDYAAKIMDASSWTQTKEDEHAVFVKFEEDAQYKFTLNYTDLSGRADFYTTQEFVIDNKDPELKVTLVPDGSAAKNDKYFNEKRTATIEIEEHNFDAKHVAINVTSTRKLDANTVVEDYQKVLTNQANWTSVGDVHTATIDFTVDANYTFTVDYTDLSGRVATQHAEKEFVIDNMNPELKVTLEPADSEAKNGKYYSTKRTASIVINEHNFDEKDVVINVTPTRKLDEQAVIEDYQAKLNNPDSWSHSGDIHTATIDFTVDANYTFTVDYTDLSGRKAAQYVSEEFVIDNVDPTLNVTVSPDDSAAKNDKYYSAKRTATIVIEEHNFDAKDVVINVTPTRKLDEQAVIEDYQAKLNNPDSWSHSGDIHTATIDFKVDANYTFTVDYTDLSGREALQHVEKEFVIDNVDPKLNVTLEPVDATAKNDKYYSVKRTATITIDEHNFDAKDVVINVTPTRKLDESEKIENYQVTLNNPASWKQGTENADVYTATIDFTVDANYTFTVDYTDLSGREAPQHVEKEFIIDNVDPKLNVTLNPVDATAKNDKYYSVKRTATITIDEHNFDAKDVKIDVTPTRKLEESAKIENYQKTLNNPASWKQSTENADVYTATIDFTVDANYTFTVDYTDLSGRVAPQHTEKEFVIDNVAPVLKSVVYTNKNVFAKNEKGREYVDIEGGETVTAEITINEHNFDAKDINVIVKAKDAAGKDILLEGTQQTLEAYYNALYINPNSWTSNGDVHTATIVFAQDANYTFDIEYVDLAGRSINATENRPADLFTIDREAPLNLRTEYSKGKETANIDGVEYKYYADKMTVTITGEDTISGVKEFKYGYFNDVGVSSVNASGSGVIKAEDIKQDGLSFTATFTIPKEALNAKNQFNGTIEFTAIDVLEHSTEQKEKKRIVVDNIAPTAGISYNDPVKNANGISYYAGDINGTIVINEANFYSQDLQMTVTKDGNPVPVAITWVDNSVDVHTGTFTLHEDGDYIVKIDYADRSTNKISTYTSNELTVDTKQPTISVSKVKMNSANKDEIYSFTITANDINFDAETFKPVLKAVVRDEAGSYVTKTIPLGNMTGSQDGQTYSYTIQNLEEDGIYTLSCAVKDMSDNAYANIRLDDGREYETVQFSINREGSTFAIDEYTDKVINQYYIYSVEKDIVLVEINADPITNYSVLVNGKELDGSKFKTSMTGGDNEWYKRTYSIPKELFEKEGEYNIVVRSTDKANTEAYSDVKNIKVAFVVDQTAPVLTISGLEEKGRYQTDEQTVTVIPTDDGGRLYSFKAIVYDNDGNPLKDKNGKDISVRFEMEGEELLKYLEEHDGKITFTVPEGYQNNVQIICTDCAMNSEGMTNAFDETFEKVTVSASQIVIFYANKPLFYGTVAALLAVIGGTAWFVVYKKKKNEEDK